MRVAGETRRENWTWLCALHLAGTRTENDFWRDSRDTPEAQGSWKAKGRHVVRGKRQQQRDEQLPFVVPDSQRAGEVVVLCRFGMATRRSIHDTQTESFSNDDSDASSDEGARQASIEQGDDKEI